MKKLLVFPLLALIGGCVATSNMSESEFESLKTRVNAATTIVSSRLAQEWDADKRAEAAEVIREARELIASNSVGELGAGDVLRGLVDRFGDQLGLDEQAQRDIRDASLLIEIAIGRPITVGPDAQLGERDQALVLAFVDGLLEGLE